VTRLGTAGRGQGRGEKRKKKRQRFFTNRSVGKKKWRQMGATAGSSPDTEPIEEGKVS